MFSHRYHPIEKGNFVMEENAVPLVFGPFPRQVHIRMQRPGDTIQSRHDYEKGASHLYRYHGDTWPTSAEGKKDSVEEEEDQCEMSPITIGSLPSEEELKESGKTATAKIVHILNRDQDAETLTQDLQLFLETSTRVQSPEVPRICNQMYFNDIARRQLHRKGVLGRLPQSHPRPFVWEDKKNIVPRTRVITVGYQIQFPRARKTIGRPDDMKLVLGQPVSLQGHDIWLPQDFKQKNCLKERPKSVSGIPFCPVPEKARTCTVDGKAVPRLHHTQSESFKTPWWVAREHKTITEKKKRPPSAHAPVSLARGPKFWRPYMATQTFHGGPMSANQMKMQFSSGF